jgi:glycosyltransferase involved in cell wall biosynthesis
MSKIAFLLWSADISGGTNVVFEHVKRLIVLGDDITLITEEVVDESQLDWHCEAKCFNWQTYASVDQQEFDIVLATWWRTAFMLSKVKAKHYAYFVQSIESRFYPDEEIPLKQLVEMTYSLPITYITEASWIKDYLRDEHHQDALLARNGIKKSIYQLEGEVIPRTSAGALRVLIEGPLGIDFKNVANTIDICRRSKADEVWLMTMSDVNEVEGVDRVFSRISVEDTARIYRSCDAIVKLSKVEGMFGPPLEMFHCGGTSVTYDVSGYDEYIVPDENGLVAKMDDEAAVLEYVNLLKDSPETLARLKTNALVTAKNWPDWPEASDVFFDAIKQVVGKNPDSTRLLEPLCNVAWEYYDYAEKLRLRNDNKGPNHLESRFNEFQEALASQAKMIDDRDAYILVLEKRLNGS